MIDFGNVDVLKTRNERKGNSGGGRKGQGYNGLRYSTNSKGKRTFTISNALVNRLDFANGKGFFTGVIGGTGYMFIVPDTAEFGDKAVFLKKSGKSAEGNKTLTFKADKLEEQLSSISLIEKVDVGSLDLTGKQTHKQYFNVADEDIKSEFGDSLPTEVEAVYAFVADSGNDSDDDVEEVSVLEPQASTQEAASEQEPAMAEADADDDEWG